MKWFIKTVVVAIIFCGIILNPVFAHSGRTDGNGGHHDGDDYHYHHGCPPHDHYDIDGDGDIDCPYNFGDNTNENPTSNKPSSTQNNSNSQTGNRDTSSQNPSNSNYGWPDVVFASVMVGAVLLCVYAYVAVEHEHLASCAKALFVEKVRHFIHKVTTAASLPITKTICATVTFWVVVSIGLIATISLFNLDFYAPNNGNSMLYGLYLLRAIMQPACCLIAYLLARAINEKERTACIFASNAICSIGFLLLAFMSGTITQKLVLIASGMASIIALIFEYLRIKTK